MTKTNDEIREAEKALDAGLKEDGQRVPHRGQPISQRPSRLFYLIYGVAGGETKRSNFGELHNVRRAAMGIAVHAHKAYRKVEDELRAEMMAEVRNALLGLPIGTLLSGYVVRWDSRFIAVLPKGMKVEDAQTVDLVKSADGVRRIAELRAPATPGVRVPAFIPPLPTVVQPSPAAESVAEKIGKRMAAAARTAVENP